MKKEEKKDEKKETKKGQLPIGLIIGVVALIVIIIVIFFVVGGGNGKKENTTDEPNTNEDLKKQETNIEEKHIIEAYGMSKDDAINKVKEIFNSDTFEFTAEINKEAKYVVTVKNVITEQTYKYLVDPISKSYSEMN